MFFISDFKMTEDLMKFPIQFRKPLLVTFIKQCADIGELQHQENTILERGFIYLVKFPSDFSCTSPGFLTISGLLTQFPSTEQNHHKPWC